MLADHIVQVLLGGVTIGCIYVLCGFGFMIVFSVTKLFNFAQGEFVMLGGMFAAVVYACGVPLAVAIILGITMATLVSGVLWYGWIRNPLRRGAASMTLILLTLGFDTIVSGGALVAWGTNYRELPYYFGQVSPLHIGGAVVSPQAPWVWGTLLLSVVGLTMLFDHTSIGKAFRGCSEQPVAARLVGINPQIMTFFAFVLAGALGAIGGVVLAPITMTNYGIGFTFTVKGLLAAVVGGINRAQGVVAGGLVLGLAENISAGFISTEYCEVIALSIFAVILLFRPQGILGIAEGGIV
jgi:branched-chain amino acid transport system permease protein